MGLEQIVTLFPQDPHHRLAGDDLAAFLDRLSERVIALGNGARARVRAGNFEGEARNLLDLLDTLAEARRRCRGREDLELRIWGDVTEDFARYIGRSTAELKLCAFVRPHLLLDARLGTVSRRPLDYDGVRGDWDLRTTDADDEVDRNELKTYWWLRLFGEGADGVGERFVEEGRRLRGTPFFEALEAAARTPLHEWHAWS